MKLKVRQVGNSTGVIFSKEILQRLKVKAGDEVFVSGTDKQIRLIRLHEYDFFSLVRRKLVEWGS